MHLGLEEGLAANKVEFFTLTPPWFPWAKKICAKMKFDQVWINDIVHLEELNEGRMQWLSGLAPVRLGFAVESFKYSAEEYALFPGIQRRNSAIPMRLRYITHLVLGDEKDDEEFSIRGNIRAMWLPAVIPLRYVLKENMYNPDGPAVFSGSLYGKRKQFLGHPELKGILVHPHFKDRFTVYPFIFDRLPALVKGLSRLRVPDVITLNPYLYILRWIRRHFFVQYLNGLKKYSATVNLPSLFKGYAGRVVEGMAAGCPVISWRVPDRPRTAALFQDDKEILLFDGDNPEQLARQIMRVKTEPGLANRLIENARQKVLRLHTMEIRVKQILDWIETGSEPSYS
jgi:hypothetical protein